MVRKRNDIVDMCINGGKIWTGEGWMQGSIGITKGKIVQISQSSLVADETIDARGLSVLPGIIDPHVHFALGVGPTITDDGFSGGSRAAAFGGVTTVIDFLDPVRKADDLEQAWNNRSALAQASCIDVGFHATLAHPEGDVREFTKIAKELGCPSLKVFTAYSSTDRRTSDRSIRDLLVAGRTDGTMVLVHAENESLMDLNPGTPVALHEESRPALCEVSAVLTLAELVRETQGTLYVVHVNVGTTVQRLRSEYGDLLGSKLFLETCPHYLLWNKTKYLQNDGARFTMTPPLRSPAESRLLADQFGSFDTVGTDHCAYNAIRKDKATTDQIPMGIGGVEFLLPSLWTRFGEAALAKVTTGPARIHGLGGRKGSLLPGYDADIVLFDPKARWTVEGHHGDADHSPWLGVPLVGKVISTFVRGRPVVRDGQFQQNQGQILRRKGPGRR